MRPRACRQLVGSWLAFGRARLVTHRVHNRFQVRADGVDDSWWLVAVGSWSRSGYAGVDSTCHISGGSDRVYVQVKVGFGQPPLPPPWPPPLVAVTVSTCRGRPHQPHPSLVPYLGGSDRVYVQVEVEIGHISPPSVVVRHLLLDGRVQLQEAERLVLHCSDGLPYQVQRDEPTLFGGGGGGRQGLLRAY